MPAASIAPERRARIHAFCSTVDQHQLSAIDARLSAERDRLSALDDQLSTIDAGLGEVGARLCAVDDQLNAVDDRLSVVDNQPNTTADQPSTPEDGLTTPEVRSRAVTGAVVDALRAIGVRVSTAPRDPRNCAAPDAVRLWPCRRGRDGLRLWKLPLRWRHRHGTHSTSRAADEIRAAGAVGVPRSGSI